jgi:hypothetical protein
MENSLKFIKSHPRTHYRHMVKKHGKIIGWIERSGGYTLFYGYNETGLHSRELKQISDFIESLK